MILALVFLGTSVATGIAVIWTIRQDKQQPTNEVQEVQEVQQTLQGTQLADFEPIENVDELQKIDRVVGDGDEATPNSSVTVHYTGALAATGVIFESSKDSGQPASFPLSGVIEGWTEGVPGMKVGGIRRLVIPSEKAYGESGSGSSIPPNSDLVFDIELISVDNQ